MKDIKNLIGLKTKNVINDDFLIDYIDSNVGYDLYNQPFDFVCAQHMWSGIEPEETWLYILEEGIDNDAIIVDVFLHLGVNK